MAKIAKPRSQPVVQLTITLDEVKPKVARAVAVPFRIRLDVLHEVIQAAMGWTNSHLYLFTTRGICWGEVDSDGDSNGMLPAHRTRLCDLIAETGAKSFKYVYDFGDHWQHTVKIGRMTEMPSEIADPFLLGATGRCPREDSGGAHGYLELLAALADPTHARHAESVERLGADYDPAKADDRRHTEAVSSLGRQRPKARPRERPRQSA